VKQRPLLGDPEAERQYHGPRREGDLLGWAYAYEQATRHRRPPVLVDRGLLPNAP
jgi:hypothetical protein